MKDREGADDVQELRSGLHALVEDVEPRGDALPRLLAARQRHARNRRTPRRPLIAAGGFAVAATALFLVALAVLPAHRPREAQPVSVAPNSYVAAPEPGVLASFDVVSGRQLQRLALVGGPVRAALASDGERVYARVPAPGGSDIVVVGPDGAQRRVAHADGPDEVLAAGGGRLAYLDRDSVVVAGSGAAQRIQVPAGQRVVDLAVDQDGRLAVLSSAGGRPQIRVVPPGSTAMDQLPLPAGGMCGPLAISWSGAELAALTSAECGSATASRVRVTTLNRDSGEPVGAGVPFELGALPEAGQLQLSADRLGRFLVSVSDGRQWLVDGADVRTVPDPCAHAGPCTSAPATFWG